MDKAIAQKIAKDYIIAQMINELHLSIGEGPDFPPGIWGFNPDDHYLFTYCSGSPELIGRSRYITVSKSSGKVISAGFFGE
jgi:hypothetical protein